MKLLTLFILIFFIACSKQEEKTKLSVSISAITGSTLFPGGLVVAGRNNFGNSFVRQVPATDILELELPNGSWSLAAIGWNGGAIFEGDTYCDFQAAVNLDGGTVDLNFSTSIAKCSNPIFGGQADLVNGFFKTQFNSCIGLKEHIIKDGPMVADPGGSCDGNGGPLPGDGLSFKVIIPDLMNASSIGTNLSSACQSGATSGQLDSNLRIAFGSLNFKLPYIIKSYSGAGCTGVEHTISYVHGLSQAALDNRGGATPDSGTVPAKIGLYLHQDACVGSHLTNRPFAAGTDATGYLICNGEQLVNILSATCTAVNTTGMTCSGTNNYSLGANIDLSGITPGGTEAYIENGGLTFGGSFEGNGFTISNGDKALFNIVTGDESSTADVRIRDFTLSNFVISNGVSSSLNNFGIFANEINHTSAMGEFEIEKIKILSSSINISISGHTGSIGSMAGLINSTTPHSFRKNLTYATVASTTGVTGQTIGGFIGKISGGGEVRFEENFVGANPDNFNDFSNRVFITGKDDVGGFIGYLGNASIGFGNHVFTDITADLRVGGIAGQANPAAMTYIRDSVSNVIFHPNTSGDKVGGVIGSVFDASFVNIEGVISHLEIPNTPIQIDSVGGCVGENSSGASSNLKIRDSKISYDVQANGQYYGGFIGYFYPTSAGGGDTIYGSVAKGNFDTNSAHVINIKRGGVAGYAANLVIKRSIIEDSFIVGNNYLGGIFGYNQTSSIAEEMDITIDITGQQVSGPPQYIGGLVGEMSSSSDPDRFKNIKIQSDIHLSSSGTSCNSDACGILIGKNGNSVVGYSGILWQGSIEDMGGPFGFIQAGNDNGTPPTLWGVSYYSNLVQNFTSCGGLPNATSSDPFIHDSGVCRSRFELQWHNMGYDATNSTYLAGNSLQPFPISTADDWNAIGDDSFLLGKTFSLENNIDFDTASYGGPGNIIPIGTSGASPFKGKIIPNGHTLSNITHTGSGVFPYIDEGVQIGFDYDPLKVNNLNLTCNISTCGFIGQAKQGRISINITNSIVGQDPTRGNIGGIIGEIYNASASAQVFLRNSSFQGSVSGFDSVGGLVGNLNLASATLEIKESFANLKAIEGDNAVGGLLGRAIASSTLFIENSYVIIDPLNLNPTTDFIASSAPSGGIIGSNNTGSSVDNVFIDVSQATLDVNFRAISAGGTNPAGSAYIITGANTVTAGGWAPAQSEASYSALILAVPTIINNEAPYVLKPDGKIGLRWEVFGFNEDY